MLKFKSNYSPDGTILKLNINDLIADNIKGLILDLDNTIMLPKSGEFSPEIANWIKSALTANLKIIIVTNNKDEIYLNSLSPLLDKYDIPIIIKAQKPRSKNLKKAIEYLNLPAENICIIGDRVLTDIWGGINVNIKTAFVEPLIGKKENILYRALRRMEKVFLERA
jgi:uncharacterized protein